MPVVFSGLRPGSYPTHLHSRCSGTQTYHLAVLENLVVGSNGTGSLQVASSDFGQGYCLVVYSSSTLAAVAAYRPI